MAICEKIVVKKVAGRFEFLAVIDSMALWRYNGEKWEISEQASGPVLEYGSNERRLWQC